MHDSEIVSVPGTHKFVSCNMLKLCNTRLLVINLQQTKFFLARGCSLEIMLQMVHVFGGGSYLTLLHELKV